MTARVEQQLLSFGAAVRQRRHRAALLALLAWLLLAQSLLIVHGIDHVKAERGAPCALCMASDHLAGGATPSTHYIPPQAPEVVASTVRGSVAVAFRAVYRSRAPPQPPPA